MIYADSGPERVRKHNGMGCANTSPPTTNVQYYDALHEAFGGWSSSEWSEDFESVRKIILFYDAFSRVKWD